MTKVNIKKSEHLQYKITIKKIFQIFERFFLLKVLRKRLKILFLALTKQIIKLN